jgi:iron complex outermembrane receptor protein
MKNKLIALLAIVPAALSAQTAAPASDGPVQLDRYTVTAPPDSDLSNASTKTGVPVALAAQSIEIVPRAVLDDQLAINLNDATRNVSGVTTDFGFNGSAQPLLILRGFQTVSMSASGQMSGASSYYLDGSKVQGVPINMANVQSVEVLKGPDSVLFGRGQPGGVVNVVTRTVSEVPQSSIEASASDSGTFRVIGETSGPIGVGRALLGRFSASDTHEGGDRDFVVNNLFGLSADTVWQADAKTRVSLTIDYEDQGYRNDYGIPSIGDRPADLPSSRQFNNSPDLSSTKTTSGLLEIQRKLSSRWKIDARARSLGSRTHEVDIAPYRIDLTTGADLIASSNELARYYFYIRPNGLYRLDQFTLDLNGKFETGGLSHTLVAGFDTYFARKTGTTYFEQINPVNIYHPDFTNTPRFDATQALPVEYEDYNRWTSVYVQDQVTLGHGLNLVGALRFDDTSAIFASPGTPANNDTFVTPRIGLVWEIKPGHVLFAQYQDAVDANNGRNVDGSKLAPEKSREKEVGYRYTAPDKRITSTLAIYELINSGRTDYSLYPVTIRTIGQARSRGVEWDLLGRITDRFSVIASAAYTDAIVTVDPTFGGTRLADVPLRSGSLWGRYQLDRHWAFGAGEFAVSQRQGDQGNDFQLPGYGRTDLMTSYDFKFGTVRATIQLNLDNLFNRRYYSGSHQFSQDWIQPGKPRTFTVSARFAF